MTVSPLVATDLDAGFTAAVAGFPLAAPPLTRWSALARLAERDLDLARLTEAHVDAATILAEVGGAASAVRPGQRWAVWAAEPPDGEVLAHRSGQVWALHGTKRWCSGAHLCDHALVTAHAPDGRRIFAVDLRQDGVRPRRGGWAGLGMVRSGTESVDLHVAVATEVGGPMAYLERPGFWDGAIGVAACWYGGTVGLVRPLWTAAREDRLDSHGLAHLGAVDTALAAARALFTLAAAELRPDDPLPVARRRALRVRAAVEAAALAAIERVGRALGPAPLAQDADHAQRVADLGVYLRQSHAERDLATFGGVSDQADAQLRTPAELPADAELRGLTGLPADAERGPAELPADAGLRGATGFPADAGLRGPGGLPAGGGNGRLR